jgi:hypothetical protein
MIRYFAQSLLAAIHDSVAASAGMRTLRFANTLAVDRSFGQTCKNLIFTCPINHSTAQSVNAPVERVVG